MKRAAAKQAKPLIVKLHNKWYSLGDFADKHPGGVNVLKGLHLRDASQLFDRFAHSPRAMEMMREFEMETASTDNLVEVKDDNMEAVEAYQAKIECGVPAQERANFSLLQYASLILATKNSCTKADLTLECWAKWQQGTLDLGTPEEKMTTVKALSSDYPITLSDNPARDIDMIVLKPEEMKVPHKKKKPSPEQRRLALIHSQAHIESFAIDLSWDILLRFHKQGLPAQFYCDWLKVAVDEAKHFYIWRNRLLDMGSYYGAFPVHEGLWQSAYDTKDSLLERLAIVHLVHEARGLDMAPRLKGKFVGAGDMKSARFFDEIEADELTHVDAGMHWFNYICKKDDLDAISTFHEIVREKFQGSLRPPFNHVARNGVGMSREWYLPLVHEKWRKGINP